jgi:hypothetical protein
LHTRIEGNTTYRIGRKEEQEDGEEEEKEANTGVRGHGGRVLDESVFGLILIYL